MVGFALSVVGRVLLRTDNRVEVVGLRCSSLVRPLDVRLGTQPFRLYVALSRFKIRLPALLIRTLMRHHFESHLSHRQNRERILLFNDGALTGRVHPHFEFGRDLERPDFAEASRVIRASFLLIARSKFKSTATAPFATGPSVCSLAAQHVPRVLLRNDLRVVEVVEHQIHVFFRVRRQVGALQVAVVLVNCDAHSTRRDVTRRSRPLRQFLSSFVVVELSTCSWRTNIIDAGVRRYLVFDEARSVVLQPSNFEPVSVNGTVVSAYEHAVLVLNPAGSSRHGKVVNNTWTVFAGS